MSIKVVVLEVDDNKFSEKGENLCFETELGWLKESGMNLKGYVDIPKELENIDAIETIWVKRQVEATLEQLERDGDIERYTEEQVVELVKELHGNHESVDQDMDRRVRDSLGIKE